MRFFQGMIERTQMSGRPGLKTQTANLKRSAKLEQRNQGRDLVVKLGWYAKYAMVHQKGMVIKPKTKSHLVFKTGSKWIKTMSVTIPKRLHVFEQFRANGREIILRATADQLRKAIAL